MVTVDDPFSTPCDPGYGRRIASYKIYTESFAGLRQLAIIQIKAKLDRSSINPAQNHRDHNARQPY